MIEAGKDERRLQALKIGHIAGGCLAGLVLQIHQLMFDHEVDELPGFGADLMIHLLRRPDHKGIVSGRLGIAVRENHLFVTEADGVKSETLCLRLVELPAQRHQHRAYLLAESGNLFFTVVRASLLQIADRDVILIAEILTNLIADPDQLVPNFLQARLIVLIELGIRPDRRAAHLAVGILKILLHAVEVQDLAVKGNLRRGHDFLVFVGQAALALAQGDILLAEELLLQVDAHKKLLAELLFQFRAETAACDGFVEGDIRLLQQGAGFVEIFHFFFVEFVAGVERVADIGKRALGVQLAVCPIPLQKDRAKLLIASGVLNRGFPFCKLLF